MRRSIAFFNAWFFLVLGVFLTLLSNGRWLLPAATWVAPVGWLVFLDRTRPSVGFAAGFVAYIAATMVMWQGLIPAPGWIYYAITLVYGIVYFLPFVVHRLLAVRLNGVTSTLVFPVAWVGMEFVFHRFLTPYGSWFSLAYTQPDATALLQITSVTGIAGVSFLIVWFGSILAWMLRTRDLGHDVGGGHRAGGTEVRGWKPVIAFGCCLFAVLLFGALRMARPLRTDTAIRTASLVANATLLGQLEDALTPARRGEELTDAEFSRLIDAAGVLNDDLIERSRGEAEAGARLITWAETAGRVLAADESEFVGNLQSLAAEFDVILMIGYGVFHPDENPPLENKVAAIDRTGDLAWEYQKAHPIVGAESGFIRAGDGIIRVLETEYGRIGAVICHDLDFPELMLSARHLDLDLVVGPSADWSDITPLHADMAVPRAIEGGFALLRPTSGGRSIATDPFGRTIAAADFPEDAMVAYLSSQRVFTLYRLVGDVFAWLCVVGLIGMTVLSRRTERAAVE